MSDKGQSLPKFGDWDVNDPASAERFTMIFNKARDDKKSGANPNSPMKDETLIIHSAAPGNPPMLFQKKWFCSIQSSPAES